MQRYVDWITANVVDAGLGQCKEITQKMVVAFPELIRVRGYYLDLLWGDRQHWWLKTVDGEIVDPTANQFPTRGSGEYVELDPDAAEPTGKCLNCGDYVYNHRSTCSDMCYSEFAASCMH